jgi:mRNA interferase RelE/StbE
MASYKIVFKSSVKKDVRDIPRLDVTRILNAIDNLATDPRPQNAKSLTGRDELRLRVGKYRVIYIVKEDEVEILAIKIGYRGGVYR